MDSTDGTSECLPGCTPAAVADSRCAAIDVSSDNAVADEFVCRNAGDCSYVSATPACGTLAYTGREWETVIRHDIAASGLHSSQDRSDIVADRMTPG